MLYKETANDFSIGIIDLLLLQATNNLFNLSEYNQADRGVPRLHQVYNVKYVVRVTVSGGGTRLNDVLALKPMDCLLALGEQGLSQKFDAAHALKQGDDIEFIKELVLSLVELVVLLNLLVPVPPRPNILLEF